MTSLQTHSLTAIVPLMLLVLLFSAWGLRRGYRTASWALGGYSMLMLTLFLLGCLFQSGFAWTSGLLTLAAMPWSTLFASATDFRWHGSSVFDNLRLNFVFFIFFCGGLNCLLILGALYIWRAAGRRDSHSRTSP